MWTFVTMRTWWFYIVNGITLYRLISAPLLVLLIFLDQLNIFKWLLPVSFFTDAIEGPIARKSKVTSVIGAKLDSIGDDLTVLAGIVGLIVFKWEFMKEQVVIIIIMCALFLIQLTLALFRYGKMTNFHTYSAKLAAIFQGVFLILTFFFDKPLYVLFYCASIITLIDVIEEIILVVMLPKWQINVKGIYWILRDKKLPKD